MGICCGKTHTEIIQVKEKKEVATSTSSLRDKSQDAQNVSSEKESDGSEIPSIPSVDTKIVTDEEDLFDTAAAKTRYSTFKHDSEYDSMRRASVYVDGRRISQDEDQIRNTLTGQRRKSEGVTTRTGKYSFPKRISLPEGQALVDFGECFKGFSADDIRKEASYFDKVILEKEKAIFLGLDQEHGEEEGKSCNVPNVENGICNIEKVDTEKESALSSNEGESQGGDGNLEESSAEKTTLILETIDKRDEDTEATSHSMDESETESFFDIKGEMLSLFNKLEADASFIHSVTVKEQDLKSMTSEEQSSNGDSSSLVREMESIFQELKQQNEPNSSAPNSDRESEADSFFDMSKEIENIISNFDQIQKTESSEEDAPAEATPGDSSDSGSFFHIQDELESRLQNIVLHLDDSGSDEECEGKKDGISKEGLSSGEGSYFNMQDEIDLRLDLIRHGNAI